MVRLMKLKRMMRMMIPPSTISSPTSIASNLHGLLSYVIWFLFISHIFVPLEFVSSLFVLCWYLFLLYLFPIFDSNLTYKFKIVSDIIWIMYLCKWQGCWSFLTLAFLKAFTFPFFMTRQFELQKSLFLNHMYLICKPKARCMLYFVIKSSPFFSLSISLVFVFSVWRLEMSIGWQIGQGWTLTTTADKFKVFLLPTLGWVLASAALSSVTT